MESKPSSTLGNDDDDDMYVGADEENEAEEDDDSGPEPRIPVFPAGTEPGSEPEPEAARAVTAACVPPDWHAPPAMSSGWRLQWVVVFRDPARVTLTKMAEDQM